MIIFLIMGMISNEEVIKIQSISYEPLWATLQKRNITQYQLIKNYHFSTGTLDALRKNQSVTLNTIHDICKILNCRIDEVVAFPDIVPNQKD